MSDGISPRWADAGQVVRCVEGQAAVTRRYGAPGVVVGGGLTARRRYLMRARLIGDGADIRAERGGERIVVSPGVRVESGRPAAVISGDQPPHTVVAERHRVIGGDRASQCCYEGVGSAN